MSKRGAAAAEDTNQTKDEDSAIEALVVSLCDKLKETNTQLVKDVVKQLGCTKVAHRDWRLLTVLHCVTTRAERAQMTVIATRSLFSCCHYHTHTCDCHEANRCGTCHCHSRGTCHCHPRSLFYFGDQCCLSQAQELFDQTLTIEATDDGMKTADGER